MSNSHTNRDIEATARDTLLSRIQGSQTTSFWALWNKFGIYLILLLFAAVLSLSTDTFLTVTNLTNVFKQSAVLGIMALGLLIPMTTGHVDLTVGAFSGLSGALMAGLSLQLGVTLGAAATLLIAVAWGLMTGFLVTRGQGLHVIVTLSLMIMCQGITLLYTNGRPIVGFPESIRVLARNLGPFPAPVIVALLVALAMFVLLRFSVLGRKFYSIGGNEEASRLSGIPTTRLVILAYVLSAASAAIAGFVRIARVYSAQPNAGVGDELIAVGAVLIGGASLEGGEGSVGGIIAGVLIIGLISNGLNLLDVNPYFQYVARGAIILFAILMDQWGRNRR